MNIEICTELYTPKLLRANPEKVFTFGDNMKAFGKGGQAIIRDEPNAFGIPTKRYPSKDNWAYFSDKEYGYGEQYLCTAGQWLIENGFIGNTPCGALTNGYQFNNYQFRADNAIEHFVSDVNRQKDL